MEDLIILLGIVVIKSDVLKVVNSTTRSLNVSQNPFLVQAVNFLYQSMVSFCSKDYEAYENLA